MSSSIQALLIICMTIVLIVTVCVVGGAIKSAGAESRREEREERPLGTGPRCSRCGHPAMMRTGECYTCPTCGDHTGIEEGPVT